MEKQLSLIKLGGVPTTSSSGKAPVIQEQAPSSDAVSQKPTAHPATPERKVGTEPYRRITRVIERIGEIRPSLPSQLAGAEAERQGNTFILVLKPFFADRLLANAQNLALIRGVISEIEEIPADAITLKIEKATETTKSAREDFETLFN